MDRSAAPWPHTEIAESQQQPLTLEAEFVAGLEATMSVPSRWAAGVGWAACGLLLALILRNRGHEFPFFAAWSLLLGPLFLPLAVDVTRWGEDRHPLRVGPASPGPGDFDVLMVLMGRPEGAADARPLLAALHNRLGELTLAGVMPFQAVNRLGGEDGRAGMSRRLEEAAVFLGEYRPGMVLLPGRAERAIPPFAQAAGIDLVVVVGAAGRSLGRLSTSCPMPVTSIRSGRRRI